MRQARAPQAPGVGRRRAPALAAGPPRPYKISLRSNGQAMIISLKYNYIYIRTRKTGSSTIESILKESLGPDDLFIREDLQVIAPIAKPGVDIPKNENLVTHITVSEIRDLIRDDVWDRLFKFTSERHPYEKCVSYAYFKNRARGKHLKKRGDRELLEKHERRDFATYLNRVVNDGEYASFKYYSIDGRSVAQDYIRLETMEEDIRRVGARVGFPVPEILPRKRQTERDDPRPARELLSPEQRDIVYEKCRPEFELHGYER
ncbi:MAG TPA: sulfotransferase family 2 domain-containing protein [Rhizomicrobium sp.]|jgi:hypothetical protein|nr:sulfotransferase family 2 domain-containing protein [Rhizomicrobium sp.]